MSIQVGQAYVGEDGQWYYYTEKDVMEKRETYYELYKDGQYVMEGKYEDCYEQYLHYPSDACAEIYKVTVSEEKVF